MSRKFPFTRQHDQMDCGPACLQMISKFYGKNYSLTELRSKAHLTREGSSMMGIGEAAEHIGFRTMGVKVPFKRIIEAPLPCILHWNQKHFVVLYEIRNNRFKIADPAAGLLTYTKEEFIQSWLSSTVNKEETGVALILEPTPAFYEKDSLDQKNITHGFRYLFGYLRRYRRFIFQLLIGLMVGSLIQLILPFLTQSIIDVGISTRDISFIYILLFAQLMLIFSRTLADFLRRWILLHLSTRINLSIISDFLIKLMRLPMSFFDSKKIGDILQRIEDHSRIERFLSSSSLNILFSFFNLVVFGVVLCLYSVPVFLVFCLSSVVYVCYILFFLKLRSEIDYKKFSQLSENRGNLIQLINGMQEIKLNNCERARRWEWERIQAKLFRFNIESTRVQQWQDGGSVFINEVKNVVITFMAATAVVNGSMTLGMMLALQYIIGQLSVPINEFVNFIRDFQDARISLDRIGEIRQLADEEEEGQGFVLHAPVLENVHAPLRFEGVTFHYDGPHSPKALDDLHLTIERGKVTAIVGVSGSGKTTLLKLLLKYYTPSTGALFLGATNLQHINPSEWRSQCGTVMQEGFIFSDTIAKNICLTDEQIDPAKLREAVRIANIGEFIHSLPLGYNTRIGPDGVGISAGQKQRILIARAAYRNPEYLFFDEATSALDANNEKVIMDNLATFYKGKTVVVIAHRLSTVKNADRIVVLDKGKIVESGTHVQLTGMKSRYFELVSNQLELGN